MSGGKNEHPEENGATDPGEDSGISHRGQHGNRDDADTDPQNRIEAEPLPPEARLMARQLSMSLSSHSGPIPPQIFDHVQPEHITKALDIAEQSGKYTADDRKSGRRYSFAYAGLAVLVLLFLTVFLSDKNPELLEKILSHLGAGILGVGGGYGIAEYRKR